MNHKIGLFLAAAIVAGSAGSVRAADGRLLQLFGTVDYYLKGDVADEVETDYDFLIDFVGNGTSEVSTSNGLGARIGVRTLLANDRVDLGLSASYVLGPEIEANFESFVPAGRAEETVETDFVRLMLEGAGRIPISETVMLRLGGGVGVGRGTAEDTITTNLVPTRTRKTNSTAFTWEISPALMVKAGRADVEIGFRYAQFPKIQETDDSYEIDWKPFGFYVGAAF